MSNVSDRLKARLKRRAIMRPAELPAYLILFCLGAILYGGGSHACHDWRAPVGALVVVACAFWLAHRLWKVSARVMPGLLFAFVVYLALEEALVFFVPGSQLPTWACVGIALVAGIIFCLLADRLIPWAPETMAAVMLLCLVLPVFYLFGATLDVFKKIGAAPRLFFSSGGNQVNVLAWTVSALGTGALIWIFVSRFTLIWAVARKMIVEALHRKVAAVLLVFFVVLLPSLPFILRTEGNPKSQVQIVLTYSLTLAQILLSILAVVLCTASVCGEIDRKQIHVTDTKPLARWQYLVGKLLGVMILCSTILFVMAASVYGLVGFLVRDRDLSHLPAQTRQRIRSGMVQTRAEVLVARHTVSPEVPDYSDEVNEAVKELRALGKPLAASTQRMKRREFTKGLREEFMSVAPMTARLWKFKGLKDDLDTPLFLSFRPMRLSEEGGDSVTGQWRFFRDAAGHTGEATTDGKLALDYVGSYPLGTYVINSSQVIAIRGGVVGATGNLYIEFRNFQQGLTVYFPAAGGMTLLQEVEGFLPNYCRSVIIIVCQIALLSAIALMAAAGLSFPVASLVVVGVFIAGMLAPWVMGATTTEHDLLHVLLRFLCYLMPHFARFSPVGDLVSGRVVSWANVGQAVACLCFGWGGVSMVLAALFYRRRELARIIV